MEAFAAAARSGPTAHADQGSVVFRRARASLEPHAYTHQDLRLDPRAGHRRGRLGGRGCHWLCLLSQEQALPDAARAPSCAAACPPSSTWWRCSSIPPMTRCAPCWIRSAPSCCSSTATKRRSNARTTASASCARSASARRAGHGRRTGRAMPCLRRSRGLVVRQLQHRLWRQRPGLRSRIARRSARRSLVASAHPVGRPEAGKRGPGGALAAAMGRRCKQRRRGRARNKKF